MSEAGRTVVTDPQIESFTPAPVARGITSSSMTQHLAVGGIVAAPSFLVQASSGMISLSESYFELDLAFDSVDAGGNHTVPNPGFIQPAFTPNMLLPDLLWSNCDTYLNSTRISGDFSQIYPWASLVRHMLTESPESGCSRAMLPLVGGVAGARMPLIPYAAGGDTFPGGNVLDPIPPATLQRAVLDFEAEGYTKYWVTAGKIERENSGAFAPAGIGPAISGQQTALYLKMLHPGDTSDMNRLSIVWRPNDSVWNMKGYLPASSELRCDLQHNPGALAFHAAAGQTSYGEPAFERSTMSLWIKRYQLSEDARESLSAKMRISPLIYNTTRSRVAQVNIAAGVTSVNTSGLLMGQRPSMVAVMFLRSSLLRAATQADRELSPWCLSGSSSLNVGGFTDICNVAVRDMQVTWGGELFPARRFEADGGDRTRPSQRAYESFAALSGGKPSMSYDTWAANYTVYFVDTTRDSTGADGFAPGVEEGSGSLTVDVNLIDDVISTPHTMIVVGMGASTVVLYASGEVRRVGY